jgi:hypothetical protein
MAHVSVLILEGVASLIYLVVKVDIDGGRARSSFCREL